MTQCFPSQQEADPKDRQDPFSKDSDPFVDLADLNSTCQVVSELLQLIQLSYISWSCKTCARLNSCENN